MNIAFDFDQAIFMRAIDGTYLDSTSSNEAIWIKHPFIYLYSYISATLQFLGLSKFNSVAIICLLSVSCALFFMWKTFLLITKDVVLALLLLLLLASTASLSSITIVFDSYTLLSTWTALVLFLYCREHYQHKTVHPAVLAFVYAMLVGVTTYMVLLAFFIEVSKAKNNIKIKNIAVKVEIRRIAVLVSFGLIYGIILMLFIYPEQLVILLNSPIDYLKRVLWAVTRPGEHASAFEVYYILFMNSIIAPAPTLVAIPDGFLMFDLRSLNYRFLQYCSIFFIYVVFIAGLFRYRNIEIIPCFLFMLVSFIFHTEYHDRGSLFLYSSHLIFPMFLCIAVGIESINTKITKTILALVIAISLWSSFEMLSELTLHIESFKDGI
jgi:hypothetical protein